MTLNPKNWTRSFGEDITRIYSAKLVMHQENDDQFALHDDTGLRIETWPKKYTWCVPQITERQFFTWLE